MTGNPTFIPKVFSTVWSSWAALNDNYITSYVCIMLQHVTRFSTVTQSGQVYLDTMLTPVGPTSACMLWQPRSQEHTCSNPIALPSLMRWQRYMLVKRDYGCSPMQKRQLIPSAHLQLWQRAIRPDHKWMYITCCHLLDCV